MSDEDNYRVEARLAGASRGISPTTEQIQTLLQRQRTHEQVTRPPPQKAFAKVMREQNGEQTSKFLDKNAPDEAVQSGGAEPGKAGKERLQARTFSTDVKTKDMFVGRRTTPVGFRHAKLTSGQNQTEQSKRQITPPTEPSVAVSIGTITAGSVPTKKTIIRG